MNNMKLLVLVFVLTTIAGCISTSTGTEKTVRDDGAAAEQNFNLGAQYYHRGNYKFAKDRLLRALSFNPKFAIAHSTLALTYEKLENNRLAAEHYEKAVRLEPKNIDVRNLFAVFLCNQRKFDEAKQQFDRAISVRPNDNAHVMMTNAGVCLSNKPDLQLAEKYFRDALEFKSSYGEALIQLASLKHETGNDLHARAFLQRYLANNAQSASALYLGIKIEKALGDDRASTDYTNQLLRDHPNSLEAQYIVGIN